MNAVCSRLCGNAIAAKLEDVEDNEIIESGLHWLTGYLVNLLRPKEMWL